MSMYSNTDAALGPNAVLGQNVDDDRAGVVVEDADRGDGVIGNNTT